MREFEKVESGRNALMVSHHVLLEVHKFLIDLAIEQPSIMRNPSKTNIRNFVMVNYGRFSNRFLRSRNSRLVEPATMLKDVLEEAFEINQRVFGDANYYPRGSSRVLKYDGPLQIDIIHAIIARELGCDLLLTFDTGFEELKRESSLNDLTIEVLGTP